MSTGYEVVEVEVVNPGRHLEYLNQTFSVEYDAPDGKRIISCYLTVTGGLYPSDGQYSPAGAPDATGTQWVTNLIYNTYAGGDDSTVPPDAQNYFRYALIDA